MPSHISQKGGATLLNIGHFCCGVVQTGGAMAWNVASDMQHSQEQGAQDITTVTRAAPMTLARPWTEGTRAVRVAVARLPDMCIADDGDTCILLQLGAAVAVGPVPVVDDRNGTPG